MVLGETLTLPPGTKSRHLVRFVTACNVQLLKCDHLIMALKTTEEFKI